MPRQALTEETCLPLSAITQGRVQLALDPAISIPIGFAMAHEEQARRYAGVRSTGVGMAAFGSAITRS